MRTTASRTSLLVLAAALSSTALLAQRPCTPPSLNLNSSGSDIFSAQQEEELGDILAGRLVLLRVTEDPVVTAYLAHIGDRLAQHLPAVQFQFRYLLIDSAWPEAFSLPGGRIYVSRGLVAQLRNPDETAAILAHEMGHIVTHQGGRDVTFLIEQVLGATQVTDRRDIEKKLDDLEATWRRNPAAFRQVVHEREQAQLLADRVALYAITSAGYSPEAYPALFNRIASTGGRTGNWLSDLLHVTPTEQVRLREILKTVEALPRACIARQPETQTGDFENWRTAVFDFEGWTKRKVSLHGVVRQVKLEPLTERNGRDVEVVRFSPDGNHLLAKKKQTLYVFTRQPLAFSFRIHAPDSHDPHFTSDSKSIAFSGVGGRVEVWDVASQKRVRVDDPQTDSPCVTTLLSPDAKALACVQADGAMSLIELPSGATILKEKGFTGRSRPTPYFFPPAEKMQFSPDAHYFVACGRHGPVVLDLRSRQQIRLPWRLEGGLGNGFLFLGSDRLLVLPDQHVLSSPPQPYSPLLYDTAAGLSLLARQRFSPITVNMKVPPATLFEFPTGKVLYTVPVGWAGLAAPTRGNYLLLRPISSRTVDIMDLKSKTIWALETSAADVYDDLCAHERLGGDLGLYSVATGKLEAHAPFPSDEDSNTYLWGEVSPGLRWLAAPPGAIWDLATGKMAYHLRPFRNGWFDGEQAFYADFPAFRDTPRGLVRIDLNQTNITPLRHIEDKYASEYGPYWVMTKPNHSEGVERLNPCHWNYPDFDLMDCDLTREVRDARDGRLLWSRRYPGEVPAFLLEPGQDRVILRWQMSGAAARDEIKGYPQLGKAWAAVQDSPGALLVEVADLATGVVRHALLVGPGLSVGLRLVGGRLIVSRRGYMEIFSLATGAKEGEIPDSPRAASRSGDLLSVIGESPNELEIYDLRSRKMLDHFAFSDDVTLDQFSVDARYLFVLTRDQTAYFLAMPGLHAASESKKG